MKLVAPEPCGEFTMGLFVNWFRPSVILLLAWSVAGCSRQIFD